MCWRNFTLKYVLVKMLDFKDKNFFQAFRLKKTKKQATYKRKKITWHQNSQWQHINEDNSGIVFSRNSKIK